MSNPNPNLVIKYGDYTHDFNSLPEASLVAMLRRGVAHFRGNEQAAKTSSKIESAIIAGLPGDDDKAKAAAWADMPSADKRAAFKAFREAHADQVAQWEAEVQDAATKALAEGTVGTSTRGPAEDPFEKLVTTALRQGVINVLKANNLKMPKKTTDVVKTPQGEFTMDQLIERRRAKPELLKAAEAEANAILRQREKAVKKAAEEGF